MNDDSNCANVFVSLNFFLFLFLKSTENVYPLHFTNKR